MPGWGSPPIPRGKRSGRADAADGPERTTPVVTTIIRAISARAVDLAARRSTSGRTRGKQGTARPATGVITTVLKRGIGFIGRDKRSDRPDLYFDRTAVDKDGFDRLRQGQRVTFDVEQDPQDHQRAVNVRPAAGNDGS